MKILTEDVDKLPVLAQILLRRALVVSGLSKDARVEITDDVNDEDIKITLGTVKGYKGNAYKTLSPKQIVTNPQAGLFLAQALQYAYLGAEQLGLKQGKDWVIWQGEDITFKPGTLIALDIESAGDIDEDTFAAGRILSIALWNGKFGVVIPEELAETEQAAETIKRLCDTCTVICHNGTFDMPYLSKRLGIRMYHHEDTLLMHFVLDNLAGEHGLKPLARRWLRAEDWDSDAKSYLKGGAYFENIPREKLYEYNLADVVWTFKLYEYFLPMLKNSGKYDYYHYRMQVTKVLNDVQMNGVAVSLDALDELEKKYQEQCDENLVVLRQHAGEDFNPQSPKQIKDYFKSKGVSSPSFDSDHLKKLRREGKEVEFIDALLAYRYAAKVIGSFIANVRRKVGEDGRIHPYYLPHGAKTGRLSAKGPAIQTMGRDSGIKRALVAAPGCKIISCDYSQAELRTVAELADDKAMIAAFQPGAPDFFDDLMTKIWPEEFPTIEAYEAFKHEHPKTAKNRRALVKSVVYGLNYGRGVAAIATALEQPIETAQHVVDQYLGAYPGLRDWQTRVRHSVGRKEEDNERKTKFGLTFNPLFVSDNNYSSTQNEALAFVPQSTANDICLNAAIKINEQAGQYGAKLIGLVHDATYVECPEETIEECSKMMEREMAKAATLVFDRVPFAAEAEVGNNWEEV
ncbi:DNA polymerase [uncultured Actinomyces sp.]|uniref:DNA polymerase n=1 Tax=uncultured Actinomyces sp. TaxID=249061 RepID=UPI0026245991|nr:DNA polymerase [uncultured Actinomyces sp.]